MTITNLSPTLLQTISTDHIVDADFINVDNNNITLMNSWFNTDPALWVEGGLVYVANTGKMGISVNELWWDEIAKILRVGTIQNAPNVLSQGMPGLVLTAGVMSNVSAQFGFGIKFCSSDAQFTSFSVTNPKFLAGIIPRATEGYNVDTDGGMAIDFLTSPNSPGATPTPLVRMSLGNEGNLTLKARDAGASSGPKIDIERNNNATTPSAGYINLQVRDGTDRFLWIDSVGKLRIHTAPPTNATDASGVIVGTQT